MKLSIVDLIFIVSQFYSSSIGNYSFFLVDGFYMVVNKLTILNKTCMVIVVVFVVIKG